MIKWIVTVALLGCPVVVTGQAASRFRQTTFANLGVPAPNRVFYCVDCRSTAPCSSGGSGAYAYRAGVAWNCNDGSPGSGGGGGGGSVTSIGLSAPNPFSVSGTPITTSGTLALTWATGQAANRFLATPSGSSGPVGLRAITAADLLSQGVTPNRCIRIDANSNIVVASGDCGVSGGTVSSVALSLPGIFSVSGSPVTNSGTLAASLVTQSPNAVFSGPATGSAAAPTFRSLVAADIPAITESKLSLSDVATANSSVSAHGFLRKLSGSSSDCLKGDGSWATCASGSPTTPGGSSTQIQFNNSLVFGGATNFLYTLATGQVTLNQGGNGNNALYGKRTTDSAPTGNFLLFQNQAGSSDLFKVGVDGAVTFNTATGVQDVVTVQNGIQLTSGTKPTCDSTTRGTFWFVAGGGGVADTVEICSKDAGGSFAWRTLL